MADDSAQFKAVVAGAQRLPPEGPASETWCGSGNRQKGSQEGGEEGCQADRCEEGSQEGGSQEGRQADRREEGSQEGRRQEGSR